MWKHGKSRICSRQTSSSANPILSIEILELIFWIYTCTPKLLPIWGLMISVHEISMDNYILTSLGYLHEQGKPNISSKWTKQWSDRTCITRDHIALNKSYKYPCMLYESTNEHVKLKYFLDIYWVSNTEMRGIHCTEATNLLIIIQGPYLVKHLNCKVKGKNWLNLIILVKDLLCKACYACIQH